MAARLRSRSWRSKIGWAFGVSVTVLGLLASIGPGLQAVADAATWLWEEPVVLALIALAGLSAFGLTLRARQPAAPEATATGEVVPNLGFELSPGHRAADKKNFEELVELLPRERIRYLEEHDFGNSWDRDVAMSFLEYVDTRNNVEHQFLDPVLEAKRKELYRATGNLTAKWVRFGVPMGANLDFYELAGSDRRRKEPPRGEHYERYVDRQQQINAAADEVVKAYDGLVREARIRVP
jgi:hypothetical protein